MLTVFFKSRIRHNCCRIVRSQNAPRPPHFTFVPMGKLVLNCVSFGERVTCTRCNHILLIFTKQIIVCYDGKSSSRIMAC